MKHIRIEQVDMNQRFFQFLKSELPQKSYDEPVENLSKRHKADPKAKSTDTAEARYEEQPSHFWQPLEFWETHFIVGRNRIMTHQIRWVPRRRSSQWQCPFCRRCSTPGPSDTLF